MIFTLGESLLDIIITTPDDVVVRPGGAMLNTAVSLARSNVEVSLITELGDDDTSGLIISFLQSNNINTDFVHSYKSSNTSLALAFLDENKKPKYTFIKNYPELRQLSKPQIFDGDDILLFGSLYSLDQKIRENILSIVNHAQKSKAIIIYDPNIRNAHHLKDQNMMDALKQNIELSNIIKGSDEDFTNIFGNTDAFTQISELRKINKEALIIITLGADGVIADYNGRIIKLPANKTNVVSTIGAGDAFNAGLIFALNQPKFQKTSLNNFNTESIEEMLLSGLKFSAQVCNSIDNYVPNKI